MKVVFRFYLSIFLAESFLYIESRNSFLDDKSKHILLCKLYDLIGIYFICKKSNSNSYNDLYKYFIIFECKD